MKVFLIRSAKVVTVFLLSCIFLTKSIDPDMGWHLSLGKEIIEKGSFANTLTYTCSSYVWINHSWLSDAAMYWIQTNVSFLALSLLFGLLTLLGVYFNYKTLIYSLKREGIKEKFIFLPGFLIVSFLVLTSFLAIRPQIVTFVFVSILLNKLIRIYYEKFSRKDIPFFLIIFILWPNLHGGFIIGYALIGLFLLATIAKFALYIFMYTDWKIASKQLRQIPKFLVILLFTLPLSLINPFFLGAWEEVFRNLLSPQNSDYISEWLAINIKQQYSLLYFLLFLSIFVLIIINRKLNYIRLVFVMVFGILSLYTIRYILVAAPIVTIALFIELIFLYKQFNKYLHADDIAKQVRSLFHAIPVVLIVIVISGGAVGFVQWVGKFTDPGFYKEYKFDRYPYKSVQFLKDNPKYQSLTFYNDYGWGGYLSLAIPEMKWFIDGRMAVWQCPGLVTETIMKDYIETESISKEWKRVLTTYNINAVLVRSNSRIANALREDKDWEIVLEDGNEIIMVKR